MRANRRHVLTAALAAAMPGTARAMTLDDVPPPGAELRVPARGGNLYARVNGALSGRRHPLIMVHGGPGGALWQFFPALPLASDRAIVLYDQLDSGRSDSPGDVANWTIDRFFSEIDAVRTAFEITEFHLLGHSWGGILATHYAASRPTGLKSLILQGTPLSDRRLAASVRQLYAALPDGAGATIEAHEKAGTTDDPKYMQAVMLFIRKHLARTSTRAIAMPYMKDIPPDRGDALANAMTGGKLAGFGGKLQGFDDEALLTRIDVPTLLLYGAFDILTPDTVRAMLPRLARGSMLELADAGHMAQFDQPIAWRKAISTFLDAQDG